jgi:molybdenum cofactor synthesis domain-containing protein
MSNSSQSSDQKQYRAALVIIGNEILSGRTEDKNINYIAQKLSERGIKLREVRVIPDVEHKIIGVIRSFTQEYDYIFTTGGIGPTHDDITGESVAKAFDVKLEQNQDAYETLADHYGPENLTDARLKMTMVPKGAKLIPNPVSGAPGFVINNVFVMAGVPQIMRAMLDHVLGSLKGGPLILSRTLTCRLPESVMADELAEIQERWPQVEIGSYPNFGRKDFGLSVVLRGIDQKFINDAAAEVDALMREKGGEPEEV